jgi:thioredoxin-like negative regulator of GroEL
MTDSPPSDTSAFGPKPERIERREQLEALLAEHDLVLLEFYTNGCGICASLEPVLGNVARVTDATVVMVNAGDDLGLAGEHNVQSVPTLVLFKDGEPVERLAEGFVGTDRLVELVASHAD